MNPQPTPRPQVAVLAGINGAGKTTAARQLLRDAMRIPSFTNADAIARGLNAFDVEAVAAAAGRVMLARLHELAAARQSFAFETTLSGRAYAPWLRELVRGGYAVHLIYYWLESADLAIGRVTGRVRAGGHHVPDDTVRRRYARSMGNFLALYRPVVTTWRVYDNSHDRRRLIAWNDSFSDTVLDPDTWTRFTGTPAMSEPTGLPTSDRIDLAATDRAHALANTEARLEHARMGRSVCEGRDGKVVWVAPAEIFARYGLDEFGRPKPE